MSQYAFTCHYLTHYMGLVFALTFVMWFRVMYVCIYPYTSYLTNFPSRETVKKVSRFIRHRNVVPFSTFNPFYIFFLKLIWTYAIRSLSIVNCYRVFRCSKVTEHENMCRVYSSNIFVACTVTMWWPCEYLLWQIDHKRTYTLCAKNSLYVSWLSCESSPQSR